MTPYSKYSSYSMRITLALLLFFASTTFVIAQNNSWKDFTGSWKVMPGNETLNVVIDQRNQVGFDFSGLNLKAWTPDRQDPASGKFVFKMVPQLSQMKKDVPPEINNKALGAGLTWYLEINLHRDDRDTSKRSMQLTLYKGRIDWVKKDPPEFTRIFNYPAAEAKEGQYKIDFTATQDAKTKCEASKNTHEEKVNFELLATTLKTITDVVNVKGSPLELKLNVNPTMSVKQGQECCNPNKPPVTYSEFKGGVEGSIELNYRLAGIPDMSTEFDFWVFKIKAELQAKIFIGTTGKLFVGAVGKFYGGLTGSDYHPECTQNCKYLTLKFETAARAGLKVLGKFAITEPWVEYDKSRFRQVDELVKAEVSAEVAANFGVELKGTYGLDDYCTKPEPGFHGSLFIGKFKGVAKFKVQLGPIKFDYNYERVWWEGIEVKYPGFGVDFHWN